jgi:hypothetical protein
MSSIEQPHCAYCGEVIGVYEPAFLRTPDGSEREGSRLTFGVELPLADSLVLHHDCRSADELASEADNGPS